MTERSDRQMGAASASATSIEEFVHHSIQRMNSQEKEIGDTGRAVQALVTQVSELTQQIQRLRVPAAPPTPAVPLAPSGSPSQSEPRLPVPEAYSGEPSYCRAFLTRCSMHFALQPRTFYNEQTKVAFVLTLLTGRATLWGTAVWENQNPCCSSFQDLSDEMKKVFDRLVSGREAARTLTELRQGRRPVSEFSIEFRTLAAECGWNEEAQWDMFLHGLADHVQKEIYSLDLPTSLNGLIDLALRVDARLSRVERRTTSTRTFGELDVQRSSGRDVISPVDDHEPMQVGRARLSREERERRRSQGLCLYCGGTEDLISNIYIHPPLGKTEMVNKPTRLSCTTGLRGGSTEEITLITSGNHTETISFLILDSPLAPVVLGHPWLIKHNPRVDWIHKAEEAGDLSNVPAEYLDLKEVFSKSRAASLPPHRPYDCAIDLLPAGAGFFFVGKKDGSLRPCIDYRGLNNIMVKNTYPLTLMSSAFERLQGASIFTKLDLRNAYHLVRIREGDEWKTAFNTPRGHFEYLVMPFGLSNSPAVFQALVNDVLRDMIDQFIYVYLDDILIFSSSLQEHVQHVRRVLQRLLENGLFVKAEKCDFHAQSVPFLGYIVSSEGMRPSPDSRKALLRFLGFANFYRRFIRNYSQLVAPLTALTSPRTAFRWSDSAEAVFAKLKSRFVSAPILITPDSSRQFVVEVDASEVGVGAVLSQRSPVDDKMHPCAFFSHRLSPAERNYDIGNRELLAVKLALEEWRHCGVTVPT
ncbi:hypothetical protein F2P79_022926 [Pimephales promelas]|nr:hypothetical protein F2P79_022926 [Pimephales promelas]